MIKLLLALSVCLITLTAFAQETLSAQAFRTVNVRTGPGTQYEIAGQLSGGTSVTVTGRSDMDSNWLQIDFNGGEGWVAFFTVTLDGSPDELAIVEPQITPTAAPFNSDQGNATTRSAESEVYVTAFRRVNVRSGPGTEFERIGTLSPGDSADVTGVSADHEWLLIDFAGNSGWVAYFVVSLTGDLSALPLIEVARLGDEIITESLTATNVTITTRFNTNLRESPEYNAPVISLIPFNTSLAVEARSLDSAWLRVTFNGSTGWLMAVLVNITPEASLTGVPVQ